MSSQLALIAVLVALPAPAVAQECFPACRQDHHCDAGVCVADAAGRPPDRPTKPPAPPRYQVVGLTTFSSLFLGDEAPTEGQPDGTYVGRRNVAFGARALIRERGAAWLAVEAAFALYHRSIFEGPGSRSGDGSGFVIAIEQVYRIPITEAAPDLLLDRKVAVDLSAGPYFLTGARDLGVQAAARLSFFWVQGGPTVSYGLETGLCAGMTVGAHAAF